MDSAACSRSSSTLLLDPQDLRLEEVQLLAPFPSLGDPLLEDLCLAGEAPSEVLGQGGVSQAVLELGQPGLQFLVSPNVGSLSTLLMARRAMSKRR